MGSVEVCGGSGLTHSLNVETASHVSTDSGSDLFHEPLVSLHLCENRPADR